MYMYRFRTPVNHLVLGEDAWVSHTDNGVCYVFDVTQTMFSQGNISEKIRIGNIDCKDEVIVDLFTGTCTMHQIIISKR